MTLFMFFIKSKQPKDSSNDGWTNKMWVYPYNRISFVNEEWLLGAGRKGEERVTALLYPD